MSLRSNTFRNRACVAALWAAVFVSTAAGSTVAGGYDIAASVVTEYGAIFRTQTPDGALTFDGSQGFFRDNPVLATMCLHVTDDSPNAAFESQTASAVSRYYNYLFSARDRNSNLLVESTVRDGDGGEITYEDVGFNSLLALDMLSLARLNIAIKRPYQALYWYEGSRSIQDAVIYASYDRHKRFFFPCAESGARNTSYYRALSALPLLFAGRIGDNDAGIIARRYLLDPSPHAPETPFDFLGGAASFGADAVAASTSLLKTTLLLDVLDERGLRGDADSFRAQAVDRARGAIDAATASNAIPAGHLAVLADRLSSDARRPFFDPLCAFDMFDELARVAGRMRDPDLVRLSSSIATVRRFLETPPQTPVPTGDVVAAETSIRTVYLAVSTLREQLSGKAPLPSDAYRAANGLDPALALGHLLDDVTVALERGENEVFRRRFGQLGLRVGATLTNESTILGGNVGVRWTFEAQKAPIRIAAADMIVGNAAYTVIADDDGVDLAPGVPVARDASLVIDEGRADTIAPLTLTLDITDGTGAHTRIHALRSVYLEHAVDVLATFPHGRMLSGETLPIDVTMLKHIPARSALRYDWYSPTGLQLVEGRSAEYTMAADEDSTTLRLTVAVPAQCRPGRFPFKLKFTADGNDVGTISSRFFRPYQWAAIGPLKPARGAEPTPFPKGQRIDLMADYDGIGGHVAWTVLDANDYNSEGDISLRDVMPSKRRGGVAFLYTVVEAPEMTSAPVFLAANAPATLIVNGVSVTDVTPGAGQTYARVDLLHGTNEFLIKVTGDAASRVSFTIGDENDVTTYGFNNNMFELAAGYNDLYRRSIGHSDTPQEAQKLVTLRYVDPAARAVSVIGSFNGWSPDQTPMRRLDGGVWEIVLTLPPGKHAYRFLVNNRQQVTDPNGGASEPDGFGGENSILFVE